MTDKVLFRDIVPYEVPSSLAALHGPSSGLIELPITVHWGPRRRYDLDDGQQATFAYQQIVREGTPAIQEALLNQRLLRHVWHKLVLPERCRATWRAVFPELAALSDRYVPASYAAQYGVGEATFAKVQARLYAWAKALRDAPAP